MAQTEEMDVIWQKKGPCGGWGAKIVGFVFELVSGKNYHATMPLQFFSPKSCLQHPNTSHV